MERWIELKTLFLTRTPFQAFLARRIASQDDLWGIDIVHVCTHATRKDETYFLELSKRAENALFFRHLGSTVSGYVNAIRAYPKWLCNYDRIYVAAWHAWYFRRLMKLGADIRTFDDGSANYTQGTEHFAGARDKAMTWLTGGIPLHEVKGRISGHYAVRPDLPNVMPKVIGVDLGIKIAGGRDPLTIAIGQRFEEYLDQAATSLIEERLAGLPYFPHPRENPPEGAIDSSLILEDYVSRMTRDHDVTLIGGFSTALITIPGVRKIYLDVDGDEKRRGIMLAAGCEVERLSS